MCNSTFQWFKEPEKAVDNLYRGLTKGGRIGIQAPARETYSPSFIRAIDKVRYDHRTRGTFLRFKNPWFFLEAAEEYKTLFEQAGFRVSFSRIECIKTYHTPEVTYNIFASGAIAGYLNRDYYDVPIDEDYVETFKSIVRDAFVNQASSEGLVELVFYRIYLVAEKD